MFSLSSVRATSYRQPLHNLRRSRLPSASIRTSLAWVILVVLRTPNMTIQVGPVRSTTAITIQMEERGLSDQQWRTREVALPSSEVVGLVRARKSLEARPS